MKRILSCCARDEMKEARGEKVAPLPASWKTVTPSTSRPLSSEHKSLKEIFADIPIPIPDRYHSEPHAVRIIHVGAGAAGLFTAYKAERMLTNYELVCYEKNATIGGTWLENRYPGCACDVPSHIYSYSFEPNPNWTSFFSPSEEIQAYFVNFYEKYNLQKYMRFNTTVRGIVWHDDKGQWEVELERKDGSRFTDWCHVLINGSGVVNKWKYPDVPNLERYQGTLVHTANWDTQIQWKGKSVAVIGSGASAVQVLPQLVDDAASLVCFARNPTWIIPNVLNVEPVHPAGKPAAAYGKHHYVAEELQLFRDDPQALLAYRKKLESSLIHLFPGFLRGSPLNEMLKQQMRQVVEVQLGGEENRELREAFLPTWSPGCRRITPSDNFLHCFQKPHVTLDRNNLASFTERGLRTVNGTEYEFDLIVCATGFDIQFTPHFRVIGRDGAHMQHEWKETPNLYLSITGPKFPNYFVVNGPRGNWNQGSTLPSHEVQIEYALQCVRKLQAERLHSLEVRQHPTTSLNRWIDAWHAQKSIWAEPCRSWYKRNTEDGRVYVWCGSMPHLLKSLKRPRWEDYRIRYWEEEEKNDGRKKEGNMWAFLGNGTTVLEAAVARGIAVDVAPYIRAEDSEWDVQMLLPPAEGSQKDI
ncbi:cyclohexanone monooxygenase [Aspergillus nidulans var. acristatus]